MTNNFEKMMEQMMATYMEKAMENMMAKMFSSMMPEVAPAEVEKPRNNAMSVEDFLALAEEEDDPVIEDNGKVAFEVVDFKPRNGRKYRKAVRYNKYLGKAVWTYNHLCIKEKYPAIKYSDNHYYADTLADFAAFASQYHIVEKLNDEQMAKVRAYWDSKKNK